MKATIVHNPTAGDESLNADVLTTTLERLGFEPIYYSTKKDSFRSGLQDPGDLVVAAGGDGTVVKVARALRGSPVPTVIVPSGTANNIARSLGITLPPLNALERGIDGVGRRFDLGVVSTAEQERTFVEGVGLGLFPAVLRAIAGKAGAPDVEVPKRVEREKSGVTLDYHRWLAVLPQVETLQLEISVDGEDLTGKYLLAEVMNLPILGPNLVVAPQADPRDGALDLVLAGARERALLHDGLSRGAKGEEVRWELPVIRGKDVRIGWREAIPRIDDDLWQGPVRDSVGSMAITVDPGAFLVKLPV
jgi:diacylglycerol kinase (ATP)